MAHRCLASAPADGLSAGLSVSPMVAAEMIAANGAERCGGLRKLYAIEFLAPEDADLQANTKRMVDGRDGIDSTPPVFLLDGKLCSDGRCAFRAAKEQLYKLASKNSGPQLGRLCIFVTQP